MSFAIRHTLAEGSHDREAGCPFPLAFYRHSFANCYLSNAETVLEQFKVK